MDIYVNGQFDKNTCVLALGCFETLHKAHLDLISKSVLLSKKYNTCAGVHLFSDRIEKVIFPDKTFKSVYTNKQRFEILEKENIDFVYVEEFDKSFMNISAYNFAQMLKNKFHAVCVVVGYDYTFGKGGEGNALLLKGYGKKLGFDVEIILPIEIDGHAVSSTDVRNSIENGDIDRVNHCLGREYTLSGKVVRDRGVGTKIGIPTANLLIDEKIILPKNGVYAGFVYVDSKSYPCVINIGFRPTFGLDKKSVEVHIIDYKADLYELTLEVYFLKRLRDENKFSSEYELVKQIKCDIDSAKNTFYTR